MLENKRYSEVDDAVIYIVPSTMCVTQNSWSDGAVVKLTGMHTNMSYVELLLNPIVLMNAAVDLFWGVGWGRKSETPSTREIKSRNSEGGG